MILKILLRLSFLKILRGKFEGNLASKFIKMGNLPKRLRTTVIECNVELPRAVRVRGVHRFYRLYQYLHLCNIFVICLCKKMQQHIQKLFSRGPLNYLQCIKFLRCTHVAYLMMVNQKKTKIKFVYYTNAENSICKAHTRITKNLYEIVWTLGMFRRPFVLPFIK